MFNRKPFVPVIALFIAFLLVGAFAACNFNWNNLTNAPTPTPSASPSPSPSPSASPSTSGSSDVNSLALFVYGYTCAAGTPEPSHGDGIIPAACTEALVTATPKQASGEDAHNHGNNLTWQSTGVADVVPGPVEFTFNRTVKVRVVNGVRQTGTETLTATLVDPAGKTFYATKTITVQ